VLYADGPPSWYGTLIEGQTDASGYLYRRNRYLDPATGRFTQEDPIGLAGGLNAYGFANGDPINYADPFGTAGVPSWFKTVIAACSFSAICITTLGPILEPPGLPGKLPRQVHSFEIDDGSAVGLGR
jgi:RHS repeat-associated protein